MQSKGFDIHIGIIGRDKNITELQQSRVRKNYTTPRFLAELEYLTSLPHTFLSFELAQLYGVPYLKSVGKQMGLPIADSSPHYEKILSVNSNRAYVSEIEESAEIMGGDLEIKDSREKARALRIAAESRKDE